MSLKDEVMKMIEEAILMKDFIKVTDQTKEFELYRSAMIEHIEVCIEHNIDRELQECICVTTK